MRGQKHNEEIKERAFAFLGSGESVAATAKTLGLKYSTVKTWERKWRESSSKLEGEAQTSADAAAGEDEKPRAQSDGVSDSDKLSRSLDEIRLEKKKQFIENAWEIIEGAQALLKRRVERAIHKEDLIDELMNVVSSAENLTDKEKEQLARRLSAIRVDDIRALSAIMASCYDKQALACGDPTLNLGGEVDLKKFEDM